jgi:hypothetical protein
METAMDRLQLLGSVLLSGSRRDKHHYGITCHQILRIVFAECVSFLI